jgi:predicted nucleic acid-binding protein
MKEFFDTSVLVASFWRDHRGHQASLKRVAAANKKKSSCALHTLAEVYATMTALPVKDLIPPDQALLFVQELRDRFTVITLNEDEYYETIRQAAERVRERAHLRCASPPLCRQDQSRGDLHLERETLQGDRSKAVTQDSNA